MQYFDILLEGQAFPQNSSSVGLITIKYPDTKTEYYLTDTGSYYDRDKLICALEARNIDVGDINYVILSHWHVDHIGNIDLFHNAQIITTSDCIETNLELNEFINSLETEDKVGEMASRLISLFPESGNSFAKFRAMANLSIRHSMQIGYLCKVYQNSRTTLISSPSQKLSEGIEVFMRNCHTKEDLITKISTSKNTAYFMGDVMVDKNDRGFLSDDMQKELGIKENDLIIPGHGKSFCW